MDFADDLGAQSLSESPELSIHSTAKNNQKKSFLRPSHRQPLRSSTDVDRKVMEQLRQATKSLEEKTNANKLLRQKLNFSLSRITELDTEITDLNIELKARREAVTQKDRELKALTGQLEERRKKAEEAVRETGGLRSQIDGLKKSLGEKDAEIEGLQTKFRADTQRLEAEIVRLRGSIERDFKEKSKRTEKTQVSDLQQVSPVAEDKKFFLSNVQDLTFQGDIPVSESYLFQNDPVVAPFEDFGGMSNVCDLPSPVSFSPRNMPDVTRSLKNVLEAHKKLLTRNKTLSQDNSRLKSQARKSQEQLDSLRRLCDSLMDELGTTLNRQVNIAQEVSNGFRKIENKVMFAKLNDDCEVSLPSNDFGSILETGDRPKPSMVHNNTEIAAKDKQDFSRLRLLDKFEKTADAAEKNNKTFDDYRVARRLKRSGQKASLNSNNLRSLVQQSNIELAREEDQSPRFDFEGDIRLEFQPNLCDDLLSRNKNLPRINSFEGMYPAERDESSPCAGCVAFGIEMKKFVDRCRTRISDRADTIRYLIDLLEDVSGRIQAGVDNIKTPVAAMADFDPYQKPVPEAPFGVNPKHARRISKVLKTIRENISDLGRKVAKKAVGYWYEKLKDILIIPLKGDVFLPSIRQSIERRFEMVDSMLEEADPDHLESKVREFEGRLKKLVQGTDAKENVGGPVNLRSRQTSFEQSAKTFEGEERWKREIQGMLKRFMEKTSQEEDPFCTIDCIEFKKQCKGFAEKATENFQKTKNELAKLVRPRERGDFANRSDVLSLADIYVDQLHQRDLLVSEIWQYFFDSLRSICKEGSIFDSSNRQKLDILTKAADRLLRDFSVNTPYRVSDLGEKINSLEVKECLAKDENAIADLCTANGNLLGSTLRMPEDPTRSIYASFVYPMCFIVEYLNIVRK